MINDLAYPMNEKAEVLLKYADMVPSGLFVEIGCIRSETYDPIDGYSTYFLADYCQILNYAHKKFCSYDIENKAVDIANKVLQDNHLFQIVLQKDGVKALAGFAERNYPINYLLLDSHKNPSFSFEQYKAALLAPGAVLIVDDAQKIEEWQYGKADYIQQIFYKQKREYEIIRTCPGWASFVAILPNGKKAGEL